MSNKGYGSRSLLAESKSSIFYFHECSFYIAMARIPSVCERAG